MSNHRRKKNKKTLIIALILIIVIICAGIFFLELYKKKQRLKDGGNIINEIKIDENEVTKERTARMLQLEELQKENTDIVAYLEIEGTNISYPVLQTTDNDFYMKKNYKKEYSKDGAIFLDKDYNWEIPSSNLLIYGHNNSNGAMFSELLKYKNEKFYKEHPTIRFTTNNEEAEYEIIAAFFSRVYYKSEKNVFRYYYFIDAKNENEYNDFIENCKKASIYNIDKTAQYGDQLITLSTCSYHTQDGRFAVVARKTK